MAKVRVQAKTTDDDDAADLNEKGATGPTKRVSKGALGVLKKTFAEKGFKGWYQVCLPRMS